MFMNFDEKSDFMVVHNAINSTSLDHMKNHTRTKITHRLSARFKTEQSAATPDSLLQCASKFTDIEL